ncbi:hypothetical protein T440DRAFT_556976 [Plenodomus tracheiphilus IPT5]|uniref:Uncharacterized protein n=1 Tax=Plenodomus tracheiphilus IPT5 TaxID=1408161 RepID=A0A6A7AXC5_9PLEO|nr:hypothetical protein T440DRAFT_556976 [Plenodomus tracheiphilus IPT5]
MSASVIQRCEIRGVAAALGRAMQSKLPRELRDMIYSQVFDDETVSALRFHDIVLPCPLTKPRHNRRRKCNLNHFRSGTPYLLNKAVVGPQIAAEAVAWIYASSDALTIGSPHSMPRFFAADPFEVNIRAKHCRLRKLTINVPLSDNASNYHHYFTPLRLLHRNFRREFHVEIWIQQRDAPSFGINELIRLAKPLGRFAKHLRTRGTPVRIFYENNAMDWKWEMEPWLRNGPKSWLDSIITLFRNEIAGILEHDCNLFTELEEVCAEMRGERKEYPQRVF